MPKISIVVPVYNAGKYLSKTLDSILGQTFSDFEVIAVNDGSLDNSLSILVDHAERDSRIKIINRPNLGPSEARNAGIEAMSGEWALFADADDLLEPDMLEILLSESEGFDMAVCGVKTHFPGKNRREKTSFLPCKEIRTYEAMQGYLSYMICHDERDTFFIPVWNKLLSTRVIKEKDIKFDKNVRLGEDFLFLAEFLKYTHKIKVTDRTWYNYCVWGKTSLAGRFHPGEPERRTIVFDALCNLYKHYEIFDQCRKDIEINEGKYSWIALRKLNYSTCTLSRKERVAYVGRILKKGRQKYILRYLRAEGGIKSLIKRVLVRIGSPGLLYMFVNRFGEKRKD